jgi:DNA gyrase subunit A
MSVKEKSISQYCNEDYLEYAMYVVEDRAIPSVIDGLKPTQRKIIFVANRVWKTGNEKPLKIFQLSGRIASEAMYHHGDCLDENTLILLEDNSYITIKKWIEKYPNDKLNVVAYDEDNKKFVIAEGCFPRLGQVTTIEYEIEVENGEIFKCTSNHPFLLKNGKWKVAEELSEDDDIMSY